MIERATRSFGDCPAPFRNSHFARIVQPVNVERDLISMSGVFPMVDSIPLPSGRSVDSGEGDGSEGLVDDKPSLMEVRCGEEEPRESLDVDGDVSSTYRWWRCWRISATARPALKLRMISRDSPHDMLKCGY